MACSKKLSFSIPSILNIFLWKFFRLVLGWVAVVPEPGGPGGPLAPPIFGRPVNPIPTMGGRFCPPFTSGTPNVFHLPASLSRIDWRKGHWCGSTYMVVRLFDVSSKTAKNHKKCIFSLFFIILPRPNTTTAWKLIPHMSNISKI